MFTTAGLFLAACLVLRAGTAASLARLEGRRMSQKPRILIFTGDGKGKTTAALGMAFRASGHGLRTCVIQFIKSDTSVGEMAAAAASTNIEIHPTGLGFLPPPDRAAVRRASRGGARPVCAGRPSCSRSGRFALVILDEICLAVARGLIDEGAGAGAARPGPAANVPGAHRPRGHARFDRPGRHGDRNALPQAWSASGAARPGGGRTMNAACPRLVIAGSGSGVGKTSLALGLARWLARQGLRVQTFKVGPDFLDPSYLAMASGRTCYNLDGWMTSRAYVRRLFARATADADIALIEGVMGMFDGASPRTLEGSTAEIAQWLAAPVLLVVNAHGAARSLAATVKGFAEFEPGVRVAGVIANHGGSPRHRAWLAESLSAGRHRAAVGHAAPRIAARACPAGTWGWSRPIRRTWPPTASISWPTPAASAWTCSAIVALARSAESFDIDEVSAPTSQTPSQSPPESPLGNRPR